MFLDAPFEGNIIFRLGLRCGTGGGSGGMPLICAILAQKVYNRFKGVSA
jgi:hypothetical protein